MRRSPWILLAFALAGCPSSSKPKATEPVSTPTTDPATQMVDDLAGLHIDRLGNPVLRWDHIPPVIAPKDRPHELMVLLVEFQDRSFDRYAGDADQGSKLAAYYQQQLFDDDYARVDTLSNYYATQSLGAYHVTGKVLPPIKLSGDRRHYGSPNRPAGGSWRDDTDPEGLVAEALGLAHDTYKDVNWGDFDRWDPQDIDKDNILDEPDGYLDHFVIVFAGGGQSSCEGLHKVREFLSPNVGMEAIDKLTPEQRECGDRMWPHRSRAKANDGRGPIVAGTMNADGGIPLSDSLWVRDYNMQSEYTDSSTFIHEFGHSIGLPDIYSRTSSNSTGSWEVMSGTASPSPQNLSAWSRLMLGWLKPKVILPPKFGGTVDETIALQRLDDATDAGDEATRAALIVLPPKERHIDLTTLPASSGSSALYTGQGNELNRKATLAVDLTGATGPIELGFDAWWEIEAGWDFAYLEVSTDQGQTWTRKTPTDPRHMPAKHGHDGKDSLPGFTGISGDLDGDGKNESNGGCDPKAELPSGEDKLAAASSPCLIPSWVHPTFDLSDLAGKSAQIRLRYYTDGAAVMRGMLIDNVSVSGVKVDGDFEGDSYEGWTLDGFSPSSGVHDLLVPHFYLVEYRDPYAPDEAGQHRYDSALAKNGTLLYANPKTNDMMAVRVKERPGVVIWYYNGAFAWSENDPSINGPGKGYLLTVDSNTEEIKLPGLEDWYQGTSDANDTHYDVSSEDAQKLLRTAYTKTACFVRSKTYLPQTGLDEAVAKSVGCGKDPAPASKIEVDGKPLRYSYDVYNELLPGKAREAYSKAGELYDTKMRKGVLSYRLRDRSLRALHTEDAPFSAEEFPDAITSYKVGDKGLEVVGSQSYAPKTVFDDKDAGLYLNAKLPFGGVAVPSYGLHLEVQPVRKGADGRNLVDVQVHWNE